MHSSPLILAIETATLGGSVCLVAGTDVLAARKGDAKISHSNRLLQDINDVLEETQSTISDVDLFAAAIGPGSFTGLRIGLSTVKALAATTGRPCLGVPTLMAIAHAAGPSKATASLLPAGRGELFAQLFSVSLKDVKPVDEAAHLSPQKTIVKYQALDELTWAGPGAQQYRALIEEHRNGPSVWSFAPVQDVLAANVGLLSLRKFEAGDTVSPEDLSAIYVRPSDAELKINAINQ